MTTGKVISGGIRWAHQLEAHASDCPDCDLVFDAATGDPIDCERCDNERALLWSAWTVEAHGACDACRARGDLTRVTLLFQVCYPCLIAEHRRLCGCERWAWAEHDVRRVHHICDLDCAVKWQHTWLVRYVPAPEPPLATVLPFERPRTRGEGED